MQTTMLISLTTENVCLDASKSHNLFSHREIPAQCKLSYTNTKSAFGGSEDVTFFATW